MVLAAAPIAATAGKALWNHGGTSNVIFQQGWRHVVSVASPASDYLRGLPGWIKRRAPRASRVGILHAESGTFAGQVARGAAEGARAAGFTEIRVMEFESPLRDAGAVVREAVEPEPDLLVSIGAFQDDVAIARQWAALPAKTALALMGPSQWEPTAGEAPLVGPDSGWFVDAFERAFHRTPEYPAAQAFAVGVIFGNAVVVAQGVSRAPPCSASRTPSRPRPSTAASASTRRRGDRSATGVRLVQWRGGRKRVIG